MPLPHNEQATIPVNRLPPLVTRGGVVFGFRAFNARVTLSKVSASTMAGTGTVTLSSGSWAFYTTLTDVTRARLLARKPRMLVAIALANKMPRQIWAMLTKEQDYQEPAAVA